MRWRVVVGFGLLVAPALVVPPAGGAPGDTTRVSVGTGGVQANGGSGGFGSSYDISADGRFVAFASSAFNLIGDDTNGAPDIFLHDRQTATTQRVSLTDADTQAAGGGTSPQISGDGRLVAFVGLVSDHVPGGAGTKRVVVRDVQAGTTTPVPIIEPSEFISFDVDMTPDGRLLAFTLVGGALVVFDRQAGTTVEVGVTPTGGPGNGSSFGPSLSGDGRYVAFGSSSSDLVAGDTNATSDVFVRDLVLGVTTRVSVADGPSPQQGNGPSIQPAISGDGNVVAFISSSFNLVPGDDNSVADIFVRDRIAGTTTREPGTAGVFTNGGVTLTPDAVTLGYTRPSAAGEQPQGPRIAVRDRTSGSSRTIFTNSFALPALSDNGALVAFSSGLTDLVPGDTNGVTDVFVHELGPGGGSATAQQSTSVTVTGTGPGTLSIAVGQNAVAFASLAPGATTPPTPVGTVTYVNTTATGPPWSATVAASDMTSGPNAIACTNLGFAPGSLGPPLTAGAPGGFTGPVTGGFCAPRTVMNGGAAVRGTFTHAGSTATVAVPASTVAGSYAGTLQYTVLG